MICYVTLGATGTGKTQFCVEKIKKQKYAIVYDFQNSGDFDFLPEFNPKKLYKKCRVIADRGFSYKDFTSICEKFYFDKNAIVVCEEASGMFNSNKKDLEMNRFLLSKRHRKTHFLLNFHNARQIPPFIMDYCDVIVIKKTMGGLNHVVSKFEDERVIKLMQLCKEDIRNTFILGVSNVNDDIFIHDYFKGETLQDLTYNRVNSYDKKKELYYKSLSEKIFKYEF